MGMYAPLTLIRAIVKTDLGVVFDNCANGEISTDAAVICSTASLRGTSIAGGGCTVERAGYSNPGGLSGLWPGWWCKGIWKHGLRGGEMVCRSKMKVHA